MKTGNKTVSLKKKHLHEAMFFMPSFLGFSLFYIISFVISLFYMFIDNIFSHKWVWFKNFALLLKNKAFLLSCKNTFVFTLICVPLIMVLAYMLASLIVKCGEKMDFAKTIISLPMFLPTASVIVFWKLLFEDNGYINYWLHRLNMQNIDFINSPKALGVIILLYVWKNIGYNVILFLSAFQTVPKAVIEAAQIDGASRSTIRYKIALPMMIPSIFIILIFSIINSFKSFKETYLLMGAYPQDNTYLLQHFMNNQFKDLNFQLLTTASFFMMVVISVIVYIFFKIENKISSSLY